MSDEAREWHRAQSLVGSTELQLSRALAALEALNRDPRDLAALQTVREVTQTLTIDLLPLLLSLDRYVRAAEAAAPPIRIE